MRIEDIKGWVLWVPVVAFSLLLAMCLDESTAPSDEIVFSQKESQGGSQRLREQGVVGVDVNQPGPDGISPLSHAILAGDATRVDALLAAGEHEWQHPVRDHCRRVRSRLRAQTAEQFDRLVAPIEGRFRKEDVEGWLKDVGFEVVAVLPGLGWRAIGRRPVAQ